MSTVSEFLNVCEDFSLQIQIEMPHADNKKISSLLRQYEDIMSYYEKNFETLKTECMGEVMDMLLDTLKCCIEFATKGTAFKLSSELRGMLNIIFNPVKSLHIQTDCVRILCVSIFDLMLDPVLESKSWIIKEILRIFSEIFLKTKRQVRYGVIKEKASYYLGRLMDLMVTADYELQAMIVETLYRMFTPVDLKKIEESLCFETNEERKAFFEINFDNFDFTTRSYLNVFNKSRNTVSSVLCYRVLFQEHYLQTPDELKEFRGIWIDFNKRADTITFFFNNAQFDNSNNNNGEWRMITIFPETISDVNITLAEGKNDQTIAIGRIVLKTSCSIWNDSPHILTTCRTLVLYSHDAENLTKLLVPSMRRVKKPKSSIFSKKVYKPLDFRKSSTPKRTSISSFMSNKAVFMEKRRKPSNENPIESYVIESDPEIDASIEANQDIENQKVTYDNEIGKNFIKDITLSETSDILQNPILNQISNKSCNRSSDNSDAISTFLTMIENLNSNKKKKKVDPFDTLLLESAFNDKPKSESTKIDMDHSSTSSSEILNIPPAQFGEEISDIENMNEDIGVHSKKKDTVQSFDEILTFGEWTSRENETEKKISSTQISRSDELPSNEIISTAIIHRRQSSSDSEDNIPLSVLKQRILGIKRKNRKKTIRTKKPRKSTINEDLDKIAVMRDDEPRTLSKNYNTNSKSLSTADHLSHQLDLFAEKWAKRTEIKRPRDVPSKREQKMVKETDFTIDFTRYNLKIEARKKLKSTKECSTTDTDFGNFNEIFHEMDVFREKFEKGLVKEASDDIKKQIFDEVKLLVDSL